MNQPLSQRNTALDVIRCLALFLVNSVHFFLHTNYYHTLLVGSRLYFFMLIRSVSMTCVPLFLLLTGYLMKNRQPTRGYYGKLPRIVCLYFLASFCCYFYRCGASGSLFACILETLNYTAAPYSWYMEMYIGLFLLIPYLNVLYNSLGEEKRRRQLILTLLLITGLTEVFNCFFYTPEAGWQLTDSPVLKQRLLPDWWQGIYPLSYYFLGAYLRDHPLKLRRRHSVLLLILAIFGNGTLNFMLNYGQEFMHGSWQSWGSILNVIQSVLLFHLLAGMEFRILSGKPARFLSRLSGLSLSAFLVSWIFDDLIYSALTRFQPVTAYQMNWYPVTTLLVFTGSLCLSWILNTLYTLAAKGIHVLCQKQPAQ